MVHKLVNTIQSFKRASHCAICIFMGFGGATLKGRPGQPTLWLRYWQIYFIL